MCFYGLRKIKIVRSKCINLYITMKSFLLKFLIIFLFGMLLTSCETAGYYSQSIVGHTKMMLARQSIDKVIEKSEGKRKQLLISAKRLRQFAVDELSLPNNDSYLSFVDMRRKHPVWSVVAANEFSISAVHWCYPVVGCASYRGYFSEAAAIAYADKMSEKGFETDVGGVTAYSTLGWFNDPLIPSMMNRGEVSMAEVMFHELAHQQFYVKGNSAFNEAFATVVGEYGTLRWLERNRPDLVLIYQQRMRVRSDFSALVKLTKQRLQNVYKAAINKEEMRDSKEAVFGQFVEDYEELKQKRWSGKGWYGAWINKPLNNARMASFGTYRDLVPQFVALLQSCGGSFERFYHAVKSQKGKGKLAIVPEACDVKSQLN